MTEPALTIADFESLAFDPDGFDHETHVYIARELILEYGQDEAGLRFARALKALTAKLEIPGKYHETITRFYVLAIAERCRLSPGADWKNFKARNRDLFDGSLLRRSYSRHRLASNDARCFFVLPDKSRAA